MSNPPLRLDGQPAPWPPAARALMLSCIERAARATVTHAPQPARGDERLRSALGAALGHPPERLTIVTGVRDTALALGWLQLPAYVERPTFAGVLKRLRRRTGAVVSLDWDRLAAVDDIVRRMLWITAPYRNPDGACLAAELRAQLGALADRHAVVQNEVYRWFADERADARARIPGATCVGSLHKLAGPNSTLGWLADAPGSELLPAALLPRPPAAWQRAWGDFLERDGLALLLPAARAAVAARRAFAHRLGLSDGDRGPFALLPLGPGVAEAGVLAQLAAEGLAANPGSAFGAPGCCRLCFTAVSPGAAERAAEVVRRAIGRGELAPPVSASEPG